MTESLILEKLGRLEDKVDKMGDTLQIVAVQSERINTLSEQVMSLWQKYDDAFGQKGIITEVKSFQASCPRDSFKDTLASQWAITRNSINVQWAVIGVISTVMAGLILKALGVVG